MDEPRDAVVRGRCACGRRFRIRHAQAGLIVTCPSCGRPISITDADLRIATGTERLVPLQPDQAEPVEAELVDDAELRLAAKGSRTGPTGRVELTHEEVQLSAAMHGGVRRPLGSERAAPPTSREPADTERLARRRSFLADLLASYYFGGDRSSALAFVATAAAGIVPWAAGRFLAGIVFFPLSLLLLAVAEVYIIVFVSHFCWRTLTWTARGEDEIPLFDPTWDLADDVVKPSWWLAVTTVLCGLPAGLIWKLAPLAEPAQSICLVVALLVGALLWPVAVLAVSLGRPLWFLRPDWLVRCAGGIGLPYLAAWFQIVVVVAVLAVFLTGGPRPVGGWSLAGHAYQIGVATLVFYLGYVLFRTLGLLYRHFHHRFPAQF